MILRLRRLLGLAVTGVLLSPEVPVFAEAASSTPSFVLAQAAGRSSIVDGLVVAAFVAAALFAVCRSSRRV